MYYNEIMINSKIKGKIDSFDGDFAIISYGANRLKWPKSNFSEEIKAGDTVFLAVYSEGENELNSKEIARSLLEEVIKGENL